MVPNAGLWTDYCRQVIRTIQGFRAGALEKVVPAFEGIAEEAERATEAEYERLGGAMPYDDQIDMSDVAEMANDHGIAYYETMSGVRQGVLNVLAVGLYHLFEQQQLFFLRRGLLSSAEGVPALFKVAEFEERLTECGVECRNFSCAGKLHELKTAANAINPRAHLSRSNFLCSRSTCDLLHSWPKHIRMFSGHGLSRRTRWVKAAM